MIGQSFKKKLENVLHLSNAIVNQFYCIVSWPVNSDMQLMKMAVICANVLNHVRESHAH
jgi:hypothetical protein